MQAVPQFTFPTLNYTFNFNNRWMGQTFTFSVQVHGQQRYQQRATWGQNPGKFVRNLPANTHLFYGSFDNKYHNDVIQQRNAVLAGLTPRKKLDDRIHYIDIDASNLGGGDGGTISSFNNPFFLGRPLPTGS